MTYQANSSTSVKHLSEAAEGFSVLPLRNSNSTIITTNAKLLAACDYPVLPSNFHLIPQAMQKRAWLCTII